MLRVREEAGDCVGKLIGVDHVGEDAVGEGVVGAGPTGDNVTGTGDASSPAVGGFRVGLMVTGKTLANGPALTGRWGGQ